MIRTVSILLTWAVWAASPAAQVGLGSGTGLADARSVLPGGLSAGATACVVGDLNGDGLADVVRAAAGGEITVLLQDAIGRFAPPDGQPPLGFVGAGGVTALAIAEIDGDGQPDVVVGLASRAEAVLRNGGPPTFRFRSATASPFPTTAVVGVTGIVAAELDGNPSGQDDLVLLSPNGPPRLLVGNGAGGYLDRSAFLPALPMFPTVGAAADLDRDPVALDLDLVLASAAGGPILALENRGGDFSQNAVQVSAATGVRVATLAVADVTADRLPDVVVGSPSAAGAPLPPSVWLNRGGFVFQRSTSIPPNGGFRAVDGFVSLRLARIDADARPDLVAVQGNGALAWGANLGNGGFDVGRGLLDPAERLGLCVADFESDGDTDLYVPGRAIEDAVLLGDGRGAFVDVANRTVASRAMPETALALVDGTGEGDPDLVGISRAGQAVFMHNDGSARFRADGLATLPTLPAGVYGDVLPIDLAQAGTPRDLVVRGVPSAGNPSGLRFLRRPSPNPTAAWLDQTTSVWRNGAVFASAIAVGQFATAAVGTGVRSDLLVGEFSGAVDLYRFDGSLQRFVPVPGAVPSIVNAPPERILVGDVTGDQLADFVTLPASGTPELFVNQGGRSFRHRPGAFPFLGAIAGGTLADVDGDGVLDLFVGSNATSQGVVLLSGLGNGAFVDNSSVSFPGLVTAGVTSVAVVASAAGGSGVRHVVLGRRNGRDLLLSAAAAGIPFARAAPLPLGGSSSTTDLLVADLDRDGDDDLVVVRADTGPGVLFNRRLQLTSVGSSQIGRAASFAVDAPPGVIAYLFFSPIVVAPAPLPPWGFLRLASPATLATLPVPPSGSTDLTFPLPLSAPLGAYPFQLATLDPNRFAIELGNLESIEVTAH